MEKENAAKRKLMLTEMEAKEELIRETAKIRLKQKEMNLKEKNRLREEKTKKKEEEMK